MLKLPVPFWRKTANDPNILDTFGIEIIQDKCDPERLPWIYRKTYEKDHKFDIFSVYRKGDYVGLLVIARHDSIDGTYFELRIFPRRGQLVYDYELQNILLFVVSEIWTTQKSKEIVLIHIESVIFFPSHDARRDHCESWRNRVALWRDVLQKYGFTLSLGCSGTMSNFFDSNTVTFQRRGPYPPKKWWNRLWPN